ncbi:MAG: hypothetical protein KDA92_14735, partial [Planctomycetales bacterium]|nr:hypothetical protein [Planctomycetales bacterium]
MNKNLFLRKFETLEPRQLLSCSPTGLAVPALSSRPSAFLKMYLDFDGDTGRWGKLGPLDFGLFDATTPPYDIDGDTGCFSSAELEQIQRIHAIVAEKYSPFDIDITTINPGELRDGRAGKVVIGGDGAWYPARAGGVALPGFFSDFDNVGYVWDGTGSGVADIAYIGEAVAHEAGHLLGLLHQVDVDPMTGEVVGEYRDGPIMGKSDDTPNGGRWTVGETALNIIDLFYLSLGTQDDVNRLMSNGFLTGQVPLRPDDHSDLRALATPLTSGVFGHTGNGVAETETDVDFFRIDSVALGSSFTVQVASNSERPMFDPRLELFDASGTLIATANGSVPSRLDEAIQVSLATSSTYFIAVRPAGNPGVDYNIGSYTVSVQPDVGDRPSNAVEISGVQFVNDTLGLPAAFGKHVKVESFTSVDNFDWYKFSNPDWETMPRGTVNVLLDNLSSNADLFLYADRDFDGLVGAAELIDQGTSSGNSAEVATSLIYPVYEYFIAVKNVDHANTNYRLTIELDHSDPEHPSNLAARGSDVIYDHVSLTDSDLYKGPLAWTRGVVAPVLNFEFRPFNADADLVIGYDDNANQILDPAEITSTYHGLVNQVTPVTGVLGRNAGRSRLLVGVRHFNGDTNFELRFGFDALPVIDLGTPLSGVAGLLDVNASQHAGQFADLLNSTDNLDILSLGTPPAGAFELQIKPPINGGANFELVADLNQNGKLDQDEWLASGVDLNFQVEQGSTTPYYLLASYDPGSAPEADYEVIYRDVYANSDTGVTPANPRMMQPGEGQLVGYAALSPEPLLDRPTVYHRLDVTQPGTLHLLLQPEEDEPPLVGAGLQVYVDKNQDEQLTDDERITGFHDGKVARNLDVNVVPGGYFIAVSVPTAEGIPA